MVNNPVQARSELGATPILETWGCNSENGRLLDVLVGSIEGYSWQSGNAVSRRYLRAGARFDYQTAVSQYQEMIAAYTSAGVKVHELPAGSGLPYQIYARDSSVMTPWGAIIGQMYSPWRRGEVKPVLQFYLDGQIPIYDIVTAGTFEGGDFMMIEPGAVLCGTSGERTSEEGIQQVKSWFEQEGWEFMIGRFDPHFLHMDVMCVMVAEKLAAVCVEVIPEDVLAWLKAKNIDILEVPYREAMDLGCNVMSLGDDRVLLPAHSTTLKARCKTMGLTVFDPDISMITKGGGGVHCMCQPLRRE
ncbi:MAG: arginine deiminase family protein [Gammaproteobacteria bacterium]|nr:arginine deiminase family protein [Gammaproteobacteria bacterium]